jgi:thiol-disulfide isomerase/thioredoxin
VTFEVATSSEATPNFRSCFVRDIHSTTPGSSARWSRRTLLGAAIASTLDLHRAEAQQTFNAAAYAGKVLYLDFWASWCGPCQLSFPYMNHLLATFDNARFAVVAVNVDHDRASADDFVRRMGSAPPIVYDARGTIAAHYHVQAMPTSLLFGRDGQLRFKHDGFEQSQIPTYDEQILELLHER